MPNEFEYQNIIAFHPGSYLEDILMDLGIDSQKFAKQLDLPVLTVDQVISGDQDVTSLIAERLSAVTGV